MKKTILLYTILLVGLQNTFCQGFDRENQYKQAMQNAKVAFEAYQYSDAVMFYREAMKIKPDALLPKYKIEDIRTIYIAKELDSINQKPVVVIDTPKKRKKKKEKIAEQLVIEERAREEATRKMNNDADIAQAELQNITTEVIEINEDTNNEDLDEDIEVNNLSHDMEIPLSKIEAKKSTEIVYDKNEDTLIEPTLTKREVSDLKVDALEKVVKSEPVNVKSETQIDEPNLLITQTEPVKKKPKVIQPLPKPVQQTEEEMLIWIKKEQERLLSVYPHVKTVEEIDKPGKHITRVIINVDNKVTIYLKVKHSWGATYFFIDEVGQELKSINEQYFNLMTNLKTYGG